MALRWWIRSLSSLMQRAYEATWPAEWLAVWLAGHLVSP